MKKQHVMIDLETMSTRSNAAIVAIGATRLFQPIGGPGGARVNFYTAVSLRGQEDHGRHIDPATILWWMQQSESARSEIANDKDLPSLSGALYQFSQWCATFSTPATLCVWGNGAAFDNVVLRESYRCLKMMAPWTYINDRCYRTLKNMYPAIAGPALDVNKAHHALYDAVWQAEHMETIVHNIGGVVL